MTQVKWDEMSKEEKAEYLRQAGSEIKSQQFLDGSKKVGDNSAVSRKYKMIMGGVSMSGWCDTEEQAKEEGQQNFKSFV
ncbi:hypothetical protein [Fodinibius sp. SL11]|uniref:hypothetical protein n=1 Tax=Fodinibius sp. SL11 TaxID=3425690 RepID=UPI003F8841C6